MKISLTIIWLVWWQSHSPLPEITIHRPTSKRKLLSHVKSIEIGLILQTGVVKSDTKTLYRLSQEIHDRFLTQFVLGDSISGLNEMGSSLFSGAESANVGDLERREGSEQMFP